MSSEPTSYKYDNELLLSMKVRGISLLSHQLQASREGLLCGTECEFAHYRVPE
jgi:hypothetical protein